jgi:hypothetical protein
LAKLLVEKGADINLKSTNNFGEPPLISAVIGGGIA